MHRFYNASRFKKKGDSEIPNIKYISLPYVNGLSQKLNKVFLPYNIKLSHKNSNNLKQFFTKIKDPVPITKQTHTVYKIPCNNCDSVYIGQTSQHLSERLNGHKYSQNSTALKKHSLNTGHKFNFNNTQILNKEQNTKSRNVLELIQIKKHQNAVNDKNEIANLSKIFYSII